MPHNEIHKLKAWYLLVDINVMCTEIEPYYNPIVEAPKVYNEYIIRGNISRTSPSDVSYVALLVSVSPECWSF